MSKLQLLFQEVDSVTITTVLLVLAGATVLLQKTLSLLNLFLDVYVRPGRSLKSFGAGQGAWAVITGASDGIGKEFAIQLAAAKFNILLVSRTRSKLEDISRELESKYGVETKLYAMDFTKGDPNDYENLRNITSQLDVGVLVNNVASNHEIPTPFLRESDEVIHNIVETNIAGLLKISKIVIPLMAARNRGLILNIGSFAGYVPTPYLSVYSGSKSFLSTWSAALGMELEPNGIVVECVNTYFVVTGMSKVRRASWMIPLPRPYVKSVLSKIGVAGGAAGMPFSSNTYLPHALANWLLDNTLGRGFWVKKNYDIHVDIRKRALRKREREAAAAKSQ